MALRDLVSHYCLNGYQQVLVSKGSLSRYRQTTVDTPYRGNTASSVVWHGCTTLMQVSRCHEVQ